MLSHHNDIKNGEFHRNRRKNRRETMLVQGELEKRCMNDKKKVLLKICYIICLYIINITSHQECQRAILQWYIHFQNIHNFSYKTHDLPANYLCHLFPVFTYQ